MQKIKTGKINVPDSDFKDENVTAHISLRLPLKTLKDLKKMSLNEKYNGRYQVLLKDILMSHIDKNKNK